MDTVVIVLLLIFSSILIYAIFIKGVKEHNKVLLELIKQPIYHVRGEQVFFENGYYLVKSFGKFELHTWSKASGFKDNINPNLYYWETLTPKFITELTVDYFLKRSQKFYRNKKLAEKSNRLNKILTDIKSN